ncbi:MAG: class I SAM-dependent methyltransferase [Patescibacteria group bacterium]
MASRENKQFEKQFKEKGFRSQRRYPNEALLQFLAGSYFGLSPRQRRKIKCLELGCGSGANLWAIAKEGISAYGLDNAPTGIRLCRKMLKKWGVSATLTLGDLRHLPYPNNHFDAIVDVVSMQHTDLEGHKESYREVFRCLKSGGRFFQWHLGDQSVSFKKSGGRRLDRFTVDNISNPEVPLHGNGLTCFLSVNQACKMIEGGGI